MLRCHKVLITVSSGYPFVQGRLPTRYSPVRRFPSIQASEEFVMDISLDLHVLGTPPAFILSQDQTLEYNGISLVSPVYQATRKYLTHSKRVALELLCFVFENCTWFPHKYYLDNIVMKNFVHLQNLCTMKFSMSFRTIRDHKDDPKSSISLIEPACQITYVSQLIYNNISSSPCQQLFYSFSKLFFTSESSGSFILQAYSMPAA